MVRKRYCPDIQWPCKLTLSSFTHATAHNAFQVGAVISFIVIGIDVFFVMQSLGELSTLFPVPGAFNEVRISNIAYGRILTLLSLLEDLLIQQLHLL